MEIFHIKNGIERPVVFFNEKHVTNAATSSGDNSRTTHCTFVMRINNSA